MPPVSLLYTTTRQYTSRFILGRDRLFVAMETDRNNLWGE